MSVKITLEIGHEASVRTKRTQEGFTHDWEVFVRGADGVNIQHYVEKVVFNLHETFPKPRRVVKEPPYALKESGYAGFNLPIEIYVKNKDEPKKIRFNYDLSLQPSGPPLAKMQREKFSFKDVSDDFKHKLLKGGGTMVSSSGLSESDAKASLEKQQQLLNKPKLGGSQEIKKHKSKCDDPRDSSLSFNSVFGTPIKRTKTPEPKVFSKDVVPKKEKDKLPEKERKNKSPNKDRDKEKEKRDKDERKKDKNKERSSKEHDRAGGKEKKREKSPKREKSSSPGLRRSSPKRSSDIRPVSPRDKDDKRKEKYKKRDKDYENKHKDKEKEKEKEREKEKEYKTKVDPKLVMNVVRDAEPSPSCPPSIPMLATVKVEKNKEKERPTIKVEPSPLTENEKPPLRIDEKKDREKHKHKKRDKEKDKRDKSSHKVKSEKKAYDSLFSSPKHERKKFVAESVDNDNSNSSCSSTKDVELLCKPPSPVPPFAETKATPEPAAAATLPSNKPKKDKDKTKRKEKRLEKEVKKRRRRSDLSVDEEEQPAAKAAKDESQATIQQDVHSTVGVASDEVRELDKQENPEDYLRILQELQHKIMTLQDNTELQKVVKMIAETGRYEVSARTFDFDLCLLERSTVRRLQEFFALSS